MSNPQFNLTMVQDICDINFYKKNGSTILYQNTNMIGADILPLYTLSEQIKVLQANDIAQQAQITALKTALNSSFATLKILLPLLPTITF